MDRATAGERAEALARIARSLSELAVGKQELLRNVCQDVRRVMRTNSAALLVLNDAGSAFEYLSHVGVPDAIVAHTVPREALDVSRPNFRPVASEVRPDVLAQTPATAWFASLGMRAHATAMVAIEGRALGLLGAACYGESRDLFLLEEETWLQTVADIIVQSVERERARRESERSEARYRQIVTSIQDGVWSIDAQGLTNYANAQMACMLGYAPEEMLGRPIFDFMDDEAKRLAQAAMQRRLQGVSERMELRYRRKDGSELRAAVSAGPVRDSSGVVLGALAVVSDLTEQRRLELKMQQAQKLESLGVLAGGIAHDFNNLLVGVMGNVGLALDDLPADHSVAERLGEIRAAALRAAELTRQMLDYAGKGRFVMQRIDLNQLVEEMSQLLTTVISKRAQVRFDLAPDLPATEGDATQLRQVVMNLITNASDALGDGAGLISIRSSIVDRAALPPGHALDAGNLAPRYVALEVRDTGCGMDACTRERIFDPFFTTKFAGRGLGLAAVHGILRSHRGAVLVESELGRGTSFKLLLPAAAGAEAVEPRPAAPDPQRRGKGLVLIADDEAAVRTIARVALERIGFEVEQAADGEEALARFKARPEAFAAVLLDLTMPKLSGDQVLLQLRQINSRVPVVLTSGYTEHDAAKHAAVSGFLQKPWLPAELVRIMRRAIDPAMGE